MLGALLYLRFTSLKNLVLARLRRLRQPKYLAGAIVGIAYFYFFFFRHARVGGRHPGPGMGQTMLVLPADTSALFMGLAALGLLVVVLFMWVLPSTKPGLVFSEAEIAFLFPAPLSRRALVHYRVLSSQFSALLQSILYAVVFNSRSISGGHALQVIVSWWAVLGIVSLHYHASSLTIARLVDRGVRPRARRGVVLGVVGLLLLGSAWSIWRGIQNLDAAAGVDAWAAAILDRGALPWVLWPFKLVVQPFFAPSLGAFLLALAPVLAILAVHYAWVVRMNVAFEEASIEKAERRAARISDMRRTGMLRVGQPPAAARRPPFDLARARWPELAFLWKNLLSTSRAWFTPRGWLITAVALVAISAAARRGFGHEYWKFGAVLATIGAMVGGAGLIYGPLLTRLDLRQDLANADILKTYPLPGWRVLLGELLAPVAILTGIVWLGILAWYLGLLGQQPPNLSATWFSPPMRIVWGVCAAAVTPVVLAMELLIPNAVPMIFPSWFHAVRTPGGGIDLMGQRLIFAFGQVFVVMLALLPGAASAALLVFVTQWLVGPALGLIFATVAVTLVLLGELWCGLWWLGGRFETFDLSAEPRS